MQLAHSLWIHSGSLRRQQAMTKADRAKGAMVTYLIFLMVIALACSLFYIWSRIQIVNIGYEINRELTLKEQLIEEGKRLALEVATLRSPVRLESLAKNDYQMDLPQKSQILNQTEAKIFEVAKSAPASAPVLPAKKKGAAAKGKNSLTPVAKNGKNQKTPAVKIAAMKKADLNPPKVATAAPIPAQR